jgi:hypothetical protein
MKRKHIGVSVITRVYNSKTKFSKEKAIQIVDGITNKVLQNVDSGEALGPSSETKVVSESRFYIYEMYLRASEHLAAVRELLDNKTLTLERLDMSLDVIASCTSLMGKIVSIADLSGGSLRQNVINARSKSIMQVKKDAAPRNVANGANGANGANVARSPTNRRRSVGGPSSRDGRTARATRVSSPITTGRSGSVMLPDLGLSDSGLAKLSDIGKKMGNKTGISGGVMDMWEKGKELTEAANDEDNNFIEHITDAMYSGRRRDQIWLLLEVPQSSDKARMLSIFMVVIISMSIGVFVMESVPQLTLYGEDSDACEVVVSK